MNKSNLRLFLVDDSALLRAGMRCLIGHVKGIELVFECDSGETCLHTFDDMRPDICIISLTLKNMPGLECIRHMHAHHPNTPLLAIAKTGNWNFAQGALYLGAKGVINLQATAAEFVHALKQVAAGHRYTQASIAQQLVQANTSHQVGIEKLTLREQEVVALILQGKSTRQIAKDLSLSPKTIANHHTHIMHKMGVSNMVQLIRLSITLELI